MPLRVALLFLSPVLLSPSLIVASSHVTMIGRFKSRTRKWDQPFFFFFYRLINLNTPRRAAWNTFFFFFFFFVTLALDFVVPSCTDLT